VILAYLGVLVFTALLTITSIRGAIPPFFIQELGPTLLRQVVLGTAVALFGISSLLFMRLYSKSKEAFQYWYSLALALIAVGLSAVFLQKAVGSPIGWAGRSAQFLGGVYFLVAVLITYMEGRLRISEEKLRSVFASSPDAITVIDLNGDMLECSQSALDIHGCSSKDEMLGKNTLEFIAKKDHERAMESLKKTLEQGSVKDIEYTFLTKDGCEFPVELSASVIKDSYSNPTGFVVIARDITERVRAGEALRESEERYRSLFEDIPVGLYRTTPVGQILDANPALVEMLGYPDRDSLLEVNAADVYVNAEDRRRWQALMEGEGVVQGFQAQLRRHDGTIIWGRDSARAILDGEGRVLYYEGAVKDITEPKMAEEALRQRADDLAALYEISQVFLGHLDTEVIIEGVCRLAVDRFGLKMAWVGLVVEGSFDVRPAFAYGFEEGYLDSIRVTWDDSPTGRGPTGTAIRSGQATVMNHIESDPTYAPWRGAAEARGYRSSVALPLCHGEQVLGALNVYSAEPAYFTDERVQVLQSFANQAAVAIQRAQLFEQVRAGREWLQKLSRQLLEVQEAERRHIARELHDEVGQALTGLKLLLDMGTRLPADEVSASLGEAQAMVNELMALVRDLSLDLRPAMLDDLGLLPALLWHFDRYTAQTNVRVTFKHTGLERRRFAPEVETAAYRIVQEALTNVARHAGVGEVTVRLWADQDMLGVQIEDWGTGFNPEAALAAGDTTGLAGMRERAMLLGGQLTVESAPGAGTHVTAEFPLGHTVEEGEKGR